MTESNRELRIGFLPWWPSNPYQVLLRAELRKQGFRVIGNPSLSMVRLIVGRDGLDVVHLHWPRALYSKKHARIPYVIIVLLLYRLIRNNVVWTVHELKPHVSKYELVDRIFVAFLIRICRVLIVHSDYSYDHIRSTFNFPRDIVRVRHPSYRGVYSNTKNSDEARQRFGFQDDEIVFAYFGYVKPYKGVETLMDTFRLFKGSNLRLLVAGVPLSEDIQKKVETIAHEDKRIHLDLRYIPDEEVQDYFNAADIIVFPFRQSHTSGSIMLALAFGKPMIVPAIASIPEYVDEQCAVFFDPSDNSGLQKAFCTTLKCDLKAMAERARLRADEYSWQELAKSHAEVYRSIC